MTLMDEKVPTDERPTRELVVAQIGNFRHPWCTEVHLKRDMEALGCHVEAFQEPDNSQDKRVFLDAFEEWCMDHRPDVVMFTRTWGLPPEATQMWRRLEALGIRTCSYHLDLYVGLQREEGILNDPFWTTQFVFTPDGDPKSAERFKELGINHHWLSPAVVSDACVPGVFEERFDYDVVFVGSEHYHPEWPWRPQLIQHLRQTYGPRFRRFAGDMPEGPIREQALNNLYASAKVVVGDSLALPGHTNYWTDRYFETVGRGGFLLGPRVPGIEDFLDERHMAFYDHPGDYLSNRGALNRVTDTIDGWLECEKATPADRDIIRFAGQQHVAAKHTYKHRLAEALGIMGFGERAADELMIDQAVRAAMSRSMPLHMPAGFETFVDFAKLDPAEFINIKPADPHGFNDGVASPGGKLGLGIFIDKLELGCGYNRTPGFTGLDANPACNPDIVAPAFPLSLGDATVGELRAVDVLEHISYRRTAEVLADWFRVLVPGGSIYLQVPDAALVMEWYVREPHRLMEKSDIANVPQTPLAMAAWRILGGHEDGTYAKDPESWIFNAHFAMFSALSLRLALEDAGFVVESLVVNNHPNICVTARKP